MIYISIDIETTGLNPKTNQIIEFSAIIEDTSKNTPLEELPHFTKIIEHDEYIGEPSALARTSRIFKAIDEKNKNKDHFLKIGNEKSFNHKGIFYNGGIFIIEFVNFLQKELPHFFPNWDNILNNSYWVDKLHNMVPLTIAGKNFINFDVKFLERIKGWEYIKREYRVIDPGILYLNPITDKKLPSLMECYNRSNIKNKENITFLKNYSYYDALLVIALIRDKFTNK